MVRWRPRAPSRETARRFVGLGNAFGASRRCVAKATEPLSYLRRKRELTWGRDYLLVCFPACQPACLPGSAHRMSDNVLGLVRRPTRLASFRGPGPGRRHLVRCVRRRACRVLRLINELVFSIMDAETLATAPLLSPWHTKKRHYPIAG